MKIRLHFNKHGAREGFPWTLHTSKACYGARHVVLHAPAETEERPERKANPRYFLTVDGTITWEKGGVAHIYGKR